MTGNRPSPQWSAGRASIAAALCCGLALSGGCTRTSDGTIVPARPLTLQSYSLAPVTNWWRRPVPQPQVQQVEQFPDAPADPVARPRNRSGKSVSRMKPRVPRFSVITKPLFKPAAEEPAKPITCRNVQSASGKVRVVCS